MFLFLLGFANSHLHLMLGPQSRRTETGESSGGLSHHLRPTVPLIGGGRSTPSIFMWLKFSRPCSAVHPAAIDHLGAGTEEVRGGKRKDFCLQPSHSPDPWLSSFPSCSWRASPRGVSSDPATYTGWEPLPGSQQRWGSGRCVLEALPRTLPESPHPPHSPLAGAGARARGQASAAILPHQGTEQQRGSTCSPGLPPWVPEPACASPAAGTCAHRWDRLKQWGVGAISTQDRWELGT